MFGLASQKPGRDLAAAQGLDVGVGLWSRVRPEDLEAGGVGLVEHGFRAGGRVPGESRRPIRERLDGIPRRVGCEAARSTLEPNRRRMDGPVIRIPPGPLAGHLRRSAARSGHRQAAPIDLTGGQDCGPVPRLTADAGREIEGVVGDGVARDRRDVQGAGVVGPEPMEIVTAAPPLDPVVPAPARLGMPGMLPDWIMEIPPEPVMKNVVGMEGPPGALVM
jgi:hypothetical protein